MGLMRPRGVAMRITDYLSKRSRTSLMLSGFALVILVGIVEYLTGPEPLVFYLIPIFLVARFVGRREGVLISFASAAVWLVAELMKSLAYSHPLIPYWNVAMRLAIFLVVTYALSGMLAAKKRQEALTQFLVHDLRSPLTNVLTGLQTLQNFAGPTADETERELLDMALISANRMLGLINALLDVPRLEAGKMPFFTTEIQPIQLVELSLDQVSLWAQQNSVALDAQVDAGGLAACADPSLTERVLVNLLSNALKFSPPCSVITLRVTLFRRDMLAFSVADQGPGIPPEWAGRVFGKFAQVEA